MKRVYTTTVALDTTMNQVIEITSIPFEMDWQFGVDASNPHLKSALSSLMFNEEGPNQTVKNWVDEKVPKHMRVTFVNTPLTIVERSPGSGVSLRDLLASGAVVAAGSGGPGEMLLLLAGTVIVIRVANDAGSKMGELVMAWLDKLKPSKPPKKGRRKKKKKKKIK